MIEYKINYNYWTDDILLSKDTIITIEEDIDIEDTHNRDELIRDILLEKLREEIGNDKIEIIDFEELEGEERWN